MDYDVDGYITLADRNISSAYRATDDEGAAYFISLAQVYATLAIAAAQAQSNQTTLDASRGGIVRD